MASSRMSRRVWRKVSTESSERACCESIDILSRTNRDEDKLQDAQGLAVFSHSKSTEPASETAAKVKVFATNLLQVPNNGLAPSTSRH